MFTLQNQILWLIMLPQWASDSYLFLMPLKALEAPCSKLRRQRLHKGKLNCSLLITFNTACCLELCRAHSCRTCTHGHKCAYVHIDTCAHVHTHANACTGMHKHTHMHELTLSIYTCTHMHVYIHMHTHVHGHTHILKFLFKDTISPCSTWSMNVRGGEVAKPHIFQQRKRK